jgi:hypothetical protein
MTVPAGTSISLPVLRADGARRAQDTADHVPLSSSIRGDDRASGHTATILAYRGLCHSCLLGDGR